MTDPERSDLTPDEDTTESAHECAEGRRQFLRRTVGVAGGLMLGATTVRAAVAKDDAAKGQRESQDLVVKLDEHQDLSKVGGYEIVETDAGKIIVARTGMSSFVACSAICTHNGCEVAYEHDSRQFVCPCHRARFELNGKVARGPAKKPLTSYPVDAAVLIGKKPR